MIIREIDAHTKTCPIMSYRDCGWTTCRGSSCMAWRPYANGIGFCGLCNPARDAGTPYEKSIKQEITTSQTADAQFWDSAGLNQ